MDFDPNVSSGGVNKYGFEHEGIQKNDRFEKLPDFTKRESVNLTGSVKTGEVPEGSNPEVLGEAQSTQAVKSEVTPLFPEASVDAEAKMLELSVYEDPPDVEEVISPQEFEQTMNEIMDSPLPPDRKLENLTILHNRILGDTAKGLIPQQESEALIDVIISKMFPLFQGQDSSKTIDIAPDGSFPTGLLQAQETLVDSGVSERPSNEAIREKIETSSAPPEEKALMLQQLSLQEQYDASRSKSSAPPSRRPPATPTRAEGQGERLTTPTLVKAEVKITPETKSGSTRKRTIMSEVGRNVRRRCSGLFGRILSEASYRLSQLSSSRSSGSSSSLDSNSVLEKKPLDSTARKETQFSSFEEPSGRNLVDSEVQEEALKPPVNPPRPAGPPPQFQLDALKEQTNSGNWNGVREKLYDLRELGDPKIQKEADAILRQMEEEAAQAPLPPPIVDQAAPPPPPPPLSDSPMFRPTRPLSNEAFAAALKGAKLNPTPTPKEKPVGQREALNAAIKAGRPNLKKVEETASEKPKAPPSVIESELEPRRAVLEEDEGEIRSDEPLEDWEQSEVHAEKPSEAAPPPPPPSSATPKANKSKFAKKATGSGGNEDLLSAIRKGKNLKPVEKTEQPPEKKAASGSLLDILKNVIPEAQDEDSEDEEEWK